MSRSESVSSPVKENSNSGLVGNNGEKQSGFVDAHIPVNEDIASMESNDLRGDDDDDHQADWVTDCESFSSVKPIVERTKNQHEIEVHGPIPSNEHDKLRCDFVDEANNLHPKAGVDGFVLLNESDRDHQIIKNRFIFGVKDLGVRVQVEHIFKNLFMANAITLAKLQTFLIYEKALKNINGGHANVCHAWFCASKDQINKVIAHGFNHDNIEKDGDFGYGLYLATDTSLMESLKSSTVDDDGMRHVLLCLVLRGKVEAVRPGSKQCHPSSDEFQTGVDNLESPKKVIIWSTHLNTHILPEFVISFKTLSGYNGPAIKEAQSGLQHYCIPVKALFSGLSKILPPEAMKKINEYHQKYLEHKISRRDLFLGFKNVAGDGPLLMVAKNYKDSNKSREMDPKAIWLVFK